MAKYTIFIIIEKNKNKYNKIEQKFLRQYPNKCLFSAT